MPDYRRAERILHLLRTTNLSQQAIAREHDVSARTVYYYATTVIRPRDAPEKVFRMRERRITASERSRIERLVAGGSTFVAAAFEVGVSIRTVLKVVYGDDYFQRWENSPD